MLINVKRSSVRLKSANAQPISPTYQRMEEQAHYIKWISTYVDNQNLSFKNLQKV